MATAKFLLEHFYYGQLVHDGKPQGEACLLAASPGITPELAKQVVTRVTLPPNPQSPIGAWALVRGRQRDIPFLLAQTQSGKAGQITTHYIIAPAEVLKAIGGNLKVLLTLVETELPVFAQPGKLSPIELAQPEPPTVDEQVETILELMTITRNSIKLIEPLLAAIVQGVQLVIQGAPPKLEERTPFIAGLLSLLPTSARFGVTFTTHSLPSTQIDAQIRFYSDDPPPENTIVFNWAKGQVTGPEFDDDYCRFITSQLRLDTASVIKHNTAMTTIAGWRLNQGDKLADALGYASKRLRLDEALLHNQPVNKDEVAKVLSADPTVPDDLRILYAQHLLRFSLAMEEMVDTTPIAALLRENPKLEHSVFQQMREALRGGKAWLIYDTLINWLAHPQGPTSKEWIELTQQAALAFIEELVNDNAIDEINNLLKDLQRVDPKAAIGAIIPRVIEMTHALCAQDAPMAKNLLLLTIRHLDTHAFAQLMNTMEFRDNLPSPVRRVWGVITHGESHADPSQLLVKMAQDFGDEWAPIVLLRFAEFACEAGQFAVLDAPTLAALLGLARSPQANRYSGQLLSVVNAVEGFALSQITPPGPLHLLQIHLVLRDYAGLAQQMLNQSRLLYAGDRQADYLKAVEQLFTEIPLPADDIVSALQTLNRGGIKSAPFIIAATCAIQKHPEDAKLDVIADQVRTQLTGARHLVDVVPPGVVLNLLRYYRVRRNQDGVTRIAELLPLATIQKGTSGVKLITEAYKELIAEKAGQAVGLKMLRTYIRHQVGDDETTRKIIAYLIKELGPEVRRPMEVTYLFNVLMAKRNIVRFAEDVRITARFLQDTAALYEGKRIFSAMDLHGSLENLRGNLDRNGRHELGNQLLTMAKAIVHLGAQYRATRQRNEERHIEALLKQEVDPGCVIDLYWWMSGFFGRVRRTPLQIHPVAYPLEGRTLENVAEEAVAASTVLNGGVLAFPDPKNIKLTRAEISAELADLRDALPYDDRVEILRGLAADLQQLADLVTKIETDGDPKAVEDSGLAKRITSGKYSPKNALEFYRFLYTYFSGA